MSNRLNEIKARLAAREGKTFLEALWDAHPTQKGTLEPYYADKRAHEDLKWCVEEIERLRRS